MLGVAAVYDFYPRPPRGGRLDAGHMHAGGSVISIHALREEGDPDKNRIRRNGRISIHALREEGDGKYAQFNSAYLINLYIS